MRTATATYHAPEGDEKSCTMAGVTFNDGDPVEINSDEHAHLMNKLPTNQHFEFEAGGDDGEPSADDGKRDFKAGIESARDHDFEIEQRANQALRDQRASDAVKRGPGRPKKVMTEEKPADPVVEPEKIDSDPLPAVAP